MCALGHGAPVVDRDRKVIGERVGCRETEINDAGDAPSVEQNVVTEEVAVNRTARQLRLRKARLKLDLGSHQRLLLVG